MTYALEFVPAARRQIAALDKPTSRRIGDKILSLRQNPRPPGVVPLKGKLRGLYRLRVGDYRILYKIVDERLVVVVVRVAHRKESYK